MISFNDKVDIMKTIKSKLITIAFLLFFTGITTYCARPMPTEKDGAFSIEYIIADSSGVLQINPDLGYAPMSYSPVILESNSYYSSFSSAQRFFGKTDQYGYIKFDFLPSSGYRLSMVKDTFYLDPVTSDTIQIQLTGFKEINDLQENISDSIYISIAHKSGIVINEIYYCGPENKAFYFYDQFVELYNTSDSTLYLDGLMITRARQARHPDIETIDFVQVLNLFQFPGEPLTGREYPIEPGQFIVVAADAIDHSEYIAKALDLHNADWEFVDHYGGDIDNPDVPNVENILPEKTNDFMINLVHNAVVLSDGSEWYWGEYNDTGTYQYIHIPISTVIDVVEYSASADKQKEITARLDAGFAGVGIEKYSGKSVERRKPGFDTNNSNLDFINLNKPTPGYQHK
jgi:hypothetical protein